MFAYVNCSIASRLAIDEHLAHNAAMKAVLVILFLALCLLNDRLASANTRIISPPMRSHGQSSEQQRLVTLHGRVVDARTGEPVAKVKVIASGADQSATTDENRAFTLEKLPIGQLEPYITTVNPGLVKT